MHRLAIVFVVLLAAVAATAASDGKAATKPQPSPTATTLPSPVVKTNTGAVRGRIIRAANGRYAQEFLNIPYAQPPVNALRFRSPKPVSNWQGERDGTQLGKGCLQSVGDFTTLFKNAIFSFSPDPSAISEDCLTVNVHTPYPAKDVNDGNAASLPVLVWIHGGGFQWGSNNVGLYNASILASEINAVVVVINYRLAAFGFFTIDGIDGVSGNQGLLDQALAIKWVHDNARHFGGDPEQITLFGESAGSASVHYHVLSPMSRDLFTRSIMQSGSATGFWAYHTPQQARQASLAFGATVSCGDGSGKTTDDFQVLKCLQSKSVAELLAADEKIKKTTAMNLVPTTDGVFLSKSPADMMRAGDFKHAAAMIGTTTNESMSLLALFYPDLLSKLPNIHLSQEQFDEMLFKMTFFLGNATRDAIKFAYRNWAVSSDNEPEMTTERWRILNSVMDDMFMNNGMIETLDAYVAAKVPIYRYRMDQISKVHAMGYDFNAAVHGDDVSFFFGHPLDPQFGYPKEEVDLSRQILHAISGFARTGNPNLHSIGAHASTTPSDTDNWKPYAGNSEFFTLNAASYGKVNIAPERWRVEFWHRAVPYLSKLEAQAGTNAARAAADKKPTMTNKDPNEIEPKLEL